MFNWIFEIKDALSMMGSMIIIIGCLALIVLVAYFVIKIPSRVGAVIFSTIGTIFLMVPVVTSFNAIVDKQATSDLAKQYKTELELKKKKRSC